MKIKIVLAVLLAVNSGLVHADQKRPNFLFVYTDDQVYDAVGVTQREQGGQARYPWLETPHMDRLAASGMRFRNAFVTMSLCSPSRAAFLTGRYNHENGVIDNRTPFPTDSETYATLLRAAGYETAFIGKWHHGMQSGQRPGFDYSASFVGQGRYFDSKFEINEEVVSTTGWADDVSTDYAIEFMKKNKDKPFLLVVAFKATHGPWKPPPRAAERFSGKKPLPAPNRDALPVYRQGKEPPPTTGRTRAVSVAGIRMNYFRCISAADDNVGRLLDALDDLGLADDTVVVFTTDNGRHLGGHGLSVKQSAYDESLRVPMLVRYPRLVGKGQVSDDMVLNIDLAPTFLELAGVPVPDEMQGKSWLPLLTGQKTEWRRSFLAEYFYKPGTVDTPTLLAVRTNKAKLIRYPGHDEWGELFDLTSDPYETQNLFYDPEHKKLLDMMTAELDLQIKSTGYRIPAQVKQPDSNGAGEPGELATEKQP